MLKKVFLNSVFLFFLLITFFILLPKQAKASVTITPPDGQINEATPSVSMTFDNLVPATDYILCGKIANNLVPDCDVHIIGQATTGPKGGIIFPSICGDGETLVKADCLSSRDYFHAGKTYGVSLFAVNGSAKNSIAQASFFVKPLYPRANVIPVNPHPGDVLIVSLTQDIIKVGGDINNSYVIDLKNSNTNYNQKECNATIKQAGVATTFSVPPNGAPKPEAGSYTLTIAEHVDKDPLHQCDLGVVLYSSPFVFDQTNGSGGGDLTPVATFAQDQQEPSAPPPPCAPNSIVNGECIAVTTAIGNISTKPSGFVTSIFSLLLGISGGVALILIIISGYRLMASQGNPEQVQGAREMLTSAIVGLLFIIFSFVILQIIGVNILHIPGFG